MNFSALVGLLLAVSVFVGAAATATQNRKIFLDSHAFLIVIGGTVAVSLLSFSGSKLVALLRIFFRRVLGQNDEVRVALKEIVEISKAYRDNEKSLKELTPKVKTHFLREGLELMMEGGMDPSELESILKKRAFTIHHRHEEDAEIFKTLSKFPPAFGLMGAVIGMIAMMQNMGGADAMATVGPSLAVALVATLYGIALANFIFLPLGENLAKANRTDTMIRQMVIDGIRLIRQKKHPLVVEETIRSYLLPGERAQFKKVA